jgi:hypothetical protein
MLTVAAACTHREYADKAAAEQSSHATRLQAESATTFTLLDAQGNPAEHRADNVQQHGRHIDTSTCDCRWDEARGQALCDPAKQHCSAEV